MATNLRCQERNGKDQRRMQTLCVYVQWKLFRKTMTISNCTENVNNKLPSNGGLFDFSTTGLIYQLEFEEKNSCLGVSPPLLTEKSPICSVSH